MTAGVFLNIYQKLDRYGLAGVELRPTKSDGCWESVVTAAGGQLSPDVTSQVNLAVNTL